MSRGITIYYKLLQKDNDKVIYGYSGANINKEFDEKYLLAYDGIIEIKMNALKHKTAFEALSDDDIKIIKECRYEWHQPRLTDDDSSVGFFAVAVISKVFRQYKSNRQIEEEGGVLF